MEAILYCIQEKQTVPVKQEELYSEQKISAAAAYQAGYERVMNKTKQANQLYGNLLTEFHSYGNYCLEELSAAIEGKYLSSYFRTLSLK